MDDRPDEPTLDQREGPSAEADGQPLDKPGDNLGLLTPEQRGARRTRLLRRLYRQWEEPLAEAGPNILLFRTVPEDPDGADHLSLLGIGKRVHTAVHQVWADAQLASDASPIGRVLHPTVALLPAGGAWTVVRSLPGLTIAEPLHLKSPAKALRAAELRWRGVTGSFTADLGALPGSVPLTQPADSASMAAEPSAPDLSNATSAGHSAVDPKPAESSRAPESAEQEQD